MRLREADGVLGKQDAYPFDPRKLKIKPGYNVRDLDSQDEREALDELKASIKERGVEEPLKVQVEGEDVFIIRGHRRHRAAMELIAEGHEVPNVLVMQLARGMNDADLNLDIIAGNDNRRDLTRLQYAEVIRRQHVVYKWDIDRIARALGKTAGAINNALSMAELPEDVKAQVNTKLVSATEAVKVVKETRDARTDPAFAAKLIQDAADEQKRLGKKGKATPKALKAASERAKPKAPAERQLKTDLAFFDQQAADERAHRDQEFEAAAPPVTGASSLDQLQEQIAGLTEPKPDGDAGAEVHNWRHPVPAGATAAVYDTPQSPHQIDRLLSSMIAATMPELASIYAKLDREHDESSAEGQDTDAQVRLVDIADNIGHVRFPGDWENAKATTELQQVA